MGRVGEAILVFHYNEDLKQSYDGESNGKFTGHWPVRDLLLGRSLHDDMKREYTMGIFLFLRT